MSESNQHSDLFAQIHNTLGWGSYEPEAAGWRASFDSRSRDEAQVALRRIEEQLEAMHSENNLLREEVRLHEESQIPKIPRAAAERMSRLEEQLEAYEKALREIAENDLTALQTRAGAHAYRQTRQFARTVLDSFPASVPQP